MAGERAYVEQVSHGCKAATESSGHAPAGTYPSSCIARSPPAQKLQLAYHLTSDREQLWMPLLTLGICPQIWRQTLCKASPTASYNELNGSTDTS